MQSRMRQSTEVASDRLLRSDVSHISHKQRVSAADYRFISSLRAPSPTTSEQSLWLDGNSDADVDDERSRLHTSEPWRPPSPVRARIEQDCGWGPLGSQHADSLSSASASTVRREIMNDVENKVKELDQLFSSQRLAHSAPGQDQLHLTVSDSVIVGETRAVYQNGVVEFSTAAPCSRYWSEAAGSNLTHAEVDLPALQWVEGLHACILKQSQVEAKAIGGAELELPQGRDAREMQHALAVLTAWRAELGVEA